MHVRRATVADAAAIAAVHTCTWQAAYEHVFGADRLAAIDVSRRVAGWERELAAGAPVFVAEDEGRIVAFVSVGESRDDDADGELFAIYALPEVWGSGAGHELMQAGVAEMREAGRRDAVLWVLEDNPRARRFYEREGWAPDGARKEDAFLGVAVPEVRYRIRLD